MTDRRVTLTLLVALAACRSNEPEPPACDPEAFVELGHKLASSSLAEQMADVWPGLVGVCQRIPIQPFTWYFDPASRGDVLPRERDAWSAQLQHAACRQWDAIMIAGSYEVSAAEAFEKCNFARYGVLSAEEVVGPAHAIMVWALHQWLLEQGLDATAIASVTRALYAREQFEGWGLEHSAELRWPKAHGVPVGNGIPVHVAGEQPRELAERGKKAGDEALVIVADIETPMETILRVVELAKESGFARYGLFVEPETFEPTYIPIRLAPEDTAERRVVISVADTPTLAQAIAVIEAATQCSENGDGCVLPEVLLSSEGADADDRKPSSGILGPSGLVDGDGQFLDEVRARAVEVKGELEPDVVRRIIEAHEKDLRGCHLRAPRLAHSERLDVTLDFTIAGSGKTQNPEVSVSNSSVRSCIAKAVRSWLFPKPEDGRPVAVSYSFELGRDTVMPRERP